MVEVLSRHPKKQAIQTSCTSCKMFHIRKVKIFCNFKIKMRQQFLFLILFCLAFSANTQTTVSINYGGQARQFMVYVPAIYATAGVPVPILLSLHGMGDNMQNFSGVGFHQIADTANFIVVTPQALTDPNPLLSLAGPAWNSGASMLGFSPNANVDDAGFLMAIVDTLAQSYQIDQNRVYVTGFSMGAYMTHRLACEKGYRIAAIASVSGTIGINVNCNPISPIPVCHFHGTADQTVNYSGNTSGMDAQEVVDYWVGINAADTNAIMTSLPDIAADGFTVDHYVYPMTANGAEVEFFKVNGADHSWLFTPTNDISYRREIWRFLSRQTNIAVGIEEDVNVNLDFLVWPNPIQNDLINFDFPENFLAGQIRITSSTGQLIFEQKVEEPGSVDVKNFPAGIYFLQLSGKEGTLNRRIVKL